MQRSADDPEDARKRFAQQLLRELGDIARLVVYVAAAPGAGKTRRLLTDAKRLAAVGKNVMIGWVETKDRPDLERLAAEMPSIPPRMVEVGGRHFPEFDLEAALRIKPDVVVLDELAHQNLPGSRNLKRWQDALSLREAGISVFGAFNIAHLETVAPTAEALIGYPVREIIPFSFLKEADEVIALDVSPEQLRARLKSGKIVRDEDIERALNGAFKETTLVMLRELLLRTIDSLTIPTVSAAATSSAAAIVMPGIDPFNFLRRSAAVASAFDLALEVIPALQVDRNEIERAVRDVDAELLPAKDIGKLDFTQLRASLVSIPAGKLAAKLVNTRVERDIFVVGEGQTYLAESSFSTPLSGTFGDRMRRGYGKLTVYLGAAAGSGKTMAMLDRGHQLKAEGVDVVVGFVETHGRAETMAMVEGLEVLPRKTISVDGMTYTEFDREALIARKPQVALIDELAHTNAPGSLASKRYMDVLAILRAGIDVMTTLNVQHLEGLSEAVYRLTGTTIRETLPDGILPLADEIILIDVTPDTLRERLRAGKIYPAERIETALANFFRVDNLAALRELAIREALRAETRERIAAPFDRLLLSVVARREDVPLVRRASRLAARLEVDFTVCHIAEPKDKFDPAALAEIERLARTLNAEWIDEASKDAAVRLIEIARARHETTVAIGGTKRTPRWPQPNSFARRMLDAGARDLIVLTRPALEGPDISDDG